MSTHNLLRHIFRHGPRDKVSEEVLPLGLRQAATEHSGVAVQTCQESARPDNKHKAATYTFTLPQKMPEPFDLEDIAEEDVNDTPSPIDTASLTETFASFGLEISIFSIRKLAHTILNEAKAAASSRLDTTNTILALLEALSGFSATISELRKEMLEKKQVYEEQLAMLDVVIRAVEGLLLAEKMKEQDSVDYGVK
jgi:hypothetical protein